MLSKDLANIANHLRLRSRQGGGSLHPMEVIGLIDALDAAVEQAQQMEARPVPAYLGGRDEALPPGVVDLLSHRRARRGVALVCRPGAGGDAV